MFFLLIAAIISIPNTYAVTHTHTTKTTSSPPTSEQTTNTPNSNTPSQPTTLSDNTNTQPTTNAPTQPTTPPPQQQPNVKLKVTPVILYIQGVGYVEVTGIQAAGGGQATITCCTSACEVK